MRNRSSFIASISRRVAPLVHELIHRHQNFNYRKHMRSCCPSRSIRQHLQIYLDSNASASMHRIETTKKRPGTPAEIIDICSQEPLRHKRRRSSRGGLDLFADPRELRTMNGVPNEAQWMNDSSDGPTTFDLAIPHEQVARFMLLTMK